MSPAFESISARQRCQSPSKSRPSKCTTFAIINDRSTRLKHKMHRMHEMHKMHEMHEMHDFVNGELSMVNGEWLMVNG